MKHTMRDPRGYSLIAVLFVVLMLALMGTAAYTLAGADASSAASSELRSQALAVAEAGLQIVSSTVDPSTIPDETANVADLEPVELGESGETKYRYLVIGAGSNGEIGHLISEGQIVRNGHVISRARVRGSVLMEAWEDPYSASAGSGPKGANVIRSGIRKPFVGGPSL